MQQELIKALSSNDEYKNTPKFIQLILSNNKEGIQVCSQVVQSILEAEQYGPQQKLIAIKFINDSILLGCQDWLKEVENSILPILEEIGKYKVEVKEDNRGENYFIFQPGKTIARKYEQIMELRQIGNSFLRYVLESIWVWSKWFPFDTASGKLSIFKICQERLSFLHVKFPQVNYFQKEDIIRYTVIQKAPRQMIRELRDQFKTNQENQQKVGLNLVQQSLQLYFRNKKNTNCQDITTDADLFRQAINRMREGALGMEIEMKLKGSHLLKLEKQLLETNKNNQKSRIIMNQHASNIQSILGDKEKLLQEISKHLNDKELLQQQKAQLNIEILKQKGEIDELKNTIIKQSKLLENRPKLEDNFMQNTIDTSHQEKLLLRKDTQIQKLEKQIESLQQIIKSQNQALFDHSQFKMQQENEYFELQSKCAEQQILIADKDAKLIQKDQQIEMLNEQLKLYQEKIMIVRQENLGTLQSQSKYIQSLEMTNSKNGSQIVELTREDQINKQKIALLEKDVQAFQEKLSLAMTSTNSNFKLSQLQKLKETPSSLQQSQTQCINIIFIFCQQSFLRKQINIEIIILYILFIYNTIIIMSSLLDQNEITDETEQVLDKFREGSKAIELEGTIKNYINARVQQQIQLSANHKYKELYYILKKLSKVILTSLKYFNNDVDKLLYYKEMMLYLLDNNQTISQNEKLTILKLPIETQVVNKSEEYLFYYFLIRQIVQTLNNIGVIMIMRNKQMEAQSYFMRSLIARSYILESYLSQYQLAMILSNMGFSLYNTNQKEDGKQFLNKSILIMEILSQPENENSDINLNLHLFQSVIHLYYLRQQQYIKETIQYYLSEPREIIRERMIYILAISYYYYSNVFEGFEAKQQQSFCIDQYKYLCELYFTLNPKAKKLQQEFHNQAKNELDSKKFKLFSDQKEDAQSSVTIKTVRSMQLNQNPPDISEDKIVFQRYILIKQKRFKVIILQFELYTQILLYRPPSFLKKLIIMYDDLNEYQVTFFPHAYDSDSKVQEFFKELIKKLFLKDDELHIRQVKHYRSYEEVQQRIEKL